MFAFIGNIGAWEVLIILLIALIVVGPGKLPEVAKGLGKAVNDFKKASSGIRQDLEDAVRIDDTPKRTPKPPLEIPEYQRLQNEVNEKADEQTEGSLIEATNEDKEKKDLV